MWDDDACSETDEFDGKVEYDDRAQCNQIFPPVNIYRHFFDKMRKFINFGIYNYCR